MCLTLRYKTVKRFLNGNLKPDVASTLECLDNIPPLSAESSILTLAMFLTSIIVSTTIVFRPCQHQRELPLTLLSTHSDGNACLNQAMNAMRTSRWMTVEIPFLYPPLVTNGSLDQNEPFVTESDVNVVKLVQLIELRSRGSRILSESRGKWKQLV
jgi:hypothetical protein